LKLKNFTKIYVLFIITCTISNMSIINFKIPNIPSVSASGEVEDYVDAQSNVDGVADKGAHSNFTTQQYTDLINDTLTEADQAPVTGNSENFVDTNTSNVDGHVGHGTSSNFTAQQDSNIAYNDTLTEANTGGTVNTEKFVDGNLSNVDAHVGHGTSSNFTAQKDANVLYNDTLTEADTNSSQAETYIYGNAASGWATNPTYVYDNVTANYAQAASISGPAWTPRLVMNLTYTARGTKIRYWVSQSNAGIYTTMNITIANSTGSWTTVYTATPTEGSYQNCSFTSSLYTAIGIERYRPTGSTSRTARANEMQAVNASRNANYEMDYEFNYTVADFGQTNEYLCIRTYTFAGSVAENLGVDWWNSTSSAWVNIAPSLTASFWNNISISIYLTAANIYFRFHGATESEDTSQNTWIIECNLIHYWTDPNYELDYEFQWTTADSAQTSEYLCIRTYTFNGGTAENIGVDVWTGTPAAWVSVSNALTASLWNNISISSYLNQSTMTFRFVGKTESGDTAQNTWIIECNLIHVWTVGVNYQLELEEQFTGANYTRTNRELCIKMGAFSGAETLLVQWWNTTSSSWLTIIASLSANDWNNISVTTYLTDLTFTIRFLDGTTSGDTVQNTWDKDSCLLHTWENTFTLSLRVYDYDLRDVISGAIVSMNNGTEYNSTSDINGWANYTGVSGSVNVRVLYFGFWVNGTFSVGMDSDKTIDVQCKLYDVTVLVQEGVQNAYLASANVTVYNSTSVQGNKITSGVTGNNGQVQLLNLPNNTLTFTQYGGASYSLVIGNTTRLVSSENQTITLTADQNNVNTNNSYSIIAFMNFSVIPYLVYLFSFAEEPHIVHDDEGLETDFSELDGFFQIMRCENEAVVGKIPERTLIKLNVEHRIVDFPVAKVEYSSRA